MKILKLLTLTALAVFITGCTPNLENLNQQSVDINSAKSENYKQQRLGIYSAKIENWDLYQEISDPADKWVGSGDCGAGEFSEFKKLASGGSMKKLQLNGPDSVALIITPNYLNWSNEKFLNFNYDTTAICAVAGRYPVKAYSDKLLWEQGCSSTGKDEPSTNCAETEEAVNKYFQ